MEQTRYSGARGGGGEGEGGGGGGGHPDAVSGLIPIPIPASVLGTDKVSIHYARVHVSAPAGTLEVRGKGA